MSCRKHRTGNPWQRVALARGQPARSADAQAPTVSEFGASVDGTVMREGCELRSLAGNRRGHSPRCYRQ